MAARSGRPLHRRILRPATAAVLIGLAAVLAPAGAALGDDSERGKPPGQCVEVRSEAVYRGYGYTHLVHLKNGCEKTMRCKVSTDVNPAVIEETLAPREARTVTTFTGSPASEFKAKVDCEEAK